MLLANENTYRKLSTFESVEAMNEAIKAHRSAHKLSETERAVLDVISRYSCKYPGVCYLSKTNIGKAVGKVRRTVIRVCQRLEALGIIKQYETKRDGGDRRQSTNVIVLLAADISPNLETSSDGRTNEVTPDMSRHKTPSNKLNNINYINTYSDEPKPFYVRFKAFISRTIGEGNQRLISRLYGVYKAHSTPLLRGQAFERADVEEVGYRALHAAVMATKTKNIRNLPGYFNGVIDRMLDRLYFETMADMGGLPAP